MKIKLSKKQTIWAGVAAFILVVAGWWMVINFMPHPLGNKLEYIGKTDYGCVLICDSNPASVYYYQTDMEPREIIAYFPKSLVLDDSDLQSHNDPSIPITFSLKAPHTDNPIIINYYAQGENQAQAWHLGHINKKHLITLSEEDYQSAKNSLR